MLSALSVKYTKLLSTYILNIFMLTGDYPLKDQKVLVCEPDILSFQLNKIPPDFAIMATDGLWDTHTNEEAINLVDKSLKKDGETVLNAAKCLARDAYNKGSTDNVSVMILNLKNML